MAALDQLDFSTFALSTRMDTIDGPNEARRQYAQLVSNMETAANPSDLNYAITRVLNSRSSADGPNMDSVAAFERALTVALRTADWLTDPELQRNVAELMMVGDATETLVVLNDALRDTVR